MKLAIAFLILILVDAGASILEAKGMKSIGEISTLNRRQLSAVAAKAARNTFLWLGLTLETVNFFLFMLVLDWTNVSLVIPIMGSGSYLISILGAKVLLSEKVGKERVIGSLLIAGGILLVAW